MLYQGRVVIFSTLIAACSGLLFGFDTGIIADTQWQLSRQFLFSHWQWSLIVSSMVLGAFAGAICSGHFTERYGRKTTLKVTALLFIIGTLTTANTHHFITLFSGRFLLGISIGISAYCAPLFIAEIAEYHKRGRMVLINNVAITGGEALAFLTGYLLQDISDNSWRWMFLLGLIPAFVLWWGLKYVPQSPRWLLKNNQEAQAFNVLKSIRNHSHDKVMTEFQLIKNNLQTNQSVALFAKPYQSRVVIGTVLGILQQTCGINVIMYYGPFLFKSSGFNEAQAMLATFIMGLLNTICTIFAMMMVDRWGRRQLLMLGSIVCALALFGLANFQTPTSLNQWLSFACVFIYTMAFAIGLGSMFWLLISELYPIAIRAKAMSFTSSIQWLANFTVSLSFLPLYDAIGRRATLMMLCFSCLVSVFFTYFFVPETKGLALEEIS
jgi:sugar porter (SP) family MFS transporter